MIRQSLDIQDFKLEAGGCLENLHIVYHTAGPRDGKVIWVCHALTANSDVEDWWPQVTGPGKLIDTDKFFVVCVNIIGSPYGTTGPASVNPATGKPFLLDFPAVTVRDTVEALVLVRKHLNINKIGLLIGSSVGGYQAIEWAVREPDVFDNVAFMATAPRISPWMTAWTETQLMALEADQTFRPAASVKGGEAGLRCARAQALISYRCFRGYDLRQSELSEDCLFAGRAASYQRHQGEKLPARGFDAYSYYYICNAMDSHNVGRGRGGVEAALASIKASATVAYIDTDGIFPPEETLAWTKFIPGARVEEIKSDFGHDGFLLETEQLNRIIGPVICKL